MIHRISAMALVAFLAGAPIATCVVAVRAHDAMAVAPGDDCGARRADHAPAFCATQMVPASGPSLAFAPAVALQAHTGTLWRAPDVLARLTVPKQNTGPPGLPPPFWLRHNAFLI